MSKQAKSAYKTQWNFKLFYQSENDPQIENDLKTTEKDFSKFEKKYKKDESYLVSKPALLSALAEYEQITSKQSVGKPLYYLYYRRDTDSDNKKISALFTQVENRLTAIQNKLVFFPLALGTIDKKIQKDILKDSQFAHFHYFLKVLWDEAKYNLSEKEEQLLSLMNQPARTMWVDGVDNVLNRQTVEHEGKQIPLAQAQGILSGLDSKARKELHEKILNAYELASDFSEAEINAVYTTKKISDELRGYEKPYSATVLRYQNDPKTVEALVDVVTKNFKIAHKFYKVKAKILGLPKLGYQDRSAAIGKVKQSFTFDDGLKIVRNALSKVDQRYVDILERYLTNGHIDVYPRIGKTGGAYCSGGDLLPTFILHNYTDSFNSVNTLAHELGHAFHTELSSSQPSIYRDYTISVAEVASTLFENFVFDEMFETLSDDEKIIALHDKVNGSIATIFRQVACFNFELELNNEIRKSGSVSKGQIAQMLNKHMKAYLGSQFELTERDGYFFVTWSHIRNHFYVYSYAFGEIISSALYEKYKTDKSYLKKIETFLSAGGSKSPYQIFKDIGIDTSKPEFFLEGLKKVEHDIRLLERLVAKKGKKK